MIEIAFFIDILKHVIAGLTVFFAGWYIIKEYLENNRSRDLLKIKKSSQQQILPLRLQAYERITLFLERINPAHMLVRLHIAEMSAREMQSIILSDIRAEYQHNISQQIYISTHSWAVVKKLRDETISMINNAVKGLPETATALDLSKTILSHLANLEDENPYDTALSIIKNDVYQLF